MKYVFTSSEAKSCAYMEKVFCLTFSVAGMIPLIMFVLNHMS